MADKESLSCFHCHLPVPVGFNQSLQYQGIERSFCCMGCYAVCQTIIDNGLDDYYKHRTETASKVDPVEFSELAIFDDDEVQETYIDKLGAELISVDLICENLQCSACSWLIEKQISKLKGVNKVFCNISDQTIYIEWDPNLVKLSKILIALHQIGYPSQPYRQEEAEQLEKQKRKLWLKRIGLAGLGMMQVMMYAVALYIGAFNDISDGHRDFLRLVSFFVATPVLFYSGLPFLTSAYRALKNLSLNMDVPISIALVLAYIASIWATYSQSGEVYFDSVTMFVFFLLIGRYLEYQVREKAKQQFRIKELDKNQLVQKLLEPETAGETSHSMLPAEKIIVGDKILIKPGAQILFDGVIIEGESSINEAMLSGEFMPVAKKAGDSVLAGSINGDIAIIIEVSHLREQGFIHKLKQMQRTALMDKPTITLLADKVARYFIVSILSIAALTFIYWWDREPAEALWITISVLVVSCPCALSLATPVALTCGVSSLNRQNVLVQDQDFLQKLEKTTDIIFDKTGTLTQGELQVDHVEVYSNYSEEELLSMIAAMEAKSEHPIAKAFEAYTDKAITANNIELFPYAGVKGRIDEKTLFFGKPDFIKNNTQLTGDDFSNNALFLSSEEKLLAKITLSDRIRINAQQLCKNLTQAGIKLHLLSGDPSDQVEKLANNLAISNWENNLSPEDKLTYIEKLKAQDKTVLTIGDGLNDAPAMALSDTSMAMAGASDLTRGSADSYLLSASLKDIAFAFKKSKQTNKVIRQNLGWALVYNATMIPFAAVGWIPPYFAAVGMSLSSIIVVINSLRLNPKSKQ